MKVTIVIEFNVPDDTPAHGVESIVNDTLADRLPAQFGFRIMEATAAPYGPQHPGGVVLISDRRSKRKG